MIEYKENGAFERDDGNMAVSLKDYEILESKLAIALQALQSIEWTTKYTAEERKVVPKDYCVADRALVTSALKAIAEAGGEK